MNHHARSITARAARGAAMALLVIAACSTPRIADIINPPRLESLTPRISGIDFSGVNLEFDAKIANTLPVAIRTPKFKYTIQVEGRELANGLHPSGLDLPAGGTGTATLPVRITYADIFAIATTLKDKPEAAYTLAGSFLIPALGREFELPLSHSGTLPVLKAPSFSDFVIDKPQVTLMGAKFSILAKIGNTNSFPLGISDMGYNLALGQLPLGGVTATTDGELAAGGSSTLKLTGEVSLLSAALQVLTGAKPGDVKLSPTGAIQTPWGKVAFSGGAGN